MLHFTTSFKKVIFDTCLVHFISPNLIILDFLF